MEKAMIHSHEGFCGANRAPTPDLPGVGGLLLVNAIKWELGERPFYSRVGNPR
jgi:hypothetical protein